jgi:hypothetical protein
MCLFCVCVVLCLDRGLAKSWSPVQGVLPSVKMINEIEESVLCSTVEVRGRNDSCILKSPSTLWARVRVTLCGHTKGRNVLVIISKYPTDVWISGAACDFLMTYGTRTLTMIHPCSCSRESIQQEHKWFQKQKKCNVNLFQCHDIPVG